MKMIVGHVVNRNLPSRQIRPETQTTSRLFSRWFTTVRTARLMIVKGGGSGAPSPIGVTFFGSDTLASSLHQEICERQVSEERNGDYNGLRLGFPREGFLLLTSTVP